MYDCDENRRIFKKCSENDATIAKFCRGVIGATDIKPKIVQVQPTSHKPDFDSDFVSEISEASEDELSDNEIDQEALHGLEVLLKIKNNPARKEASVQTENNYCSSDHEDSAELSFPLHNDEDIFWFIFLLCWIFEKQ